MRTTTFHHPVQGFHGARAVRGFTGLPDGCPACGEAVEPRRLAAHSVAADDLQLEFVFQCPRDRCRRTFVAEYAVAARGDFELVTAAAPLLSAAWPAEGSEAWRPSREYDHGAARPPRR